MIGSVRSSKCQNVCLSSTSLSKALNLQSFSDRCLSSLVDGIFLKISLKFCLFKCQLLLLARSKPAPSLPTPLFSLSIKTWKLNLDRTLITQSSGNQKMCAGKIIIKSFHTREYWKQEGILHNTRLNFNYFPNKCFTKLENGKRL